MASTSSVPRLATFALTALAFAGAAGLGAQAAAPAAGNKIAVIDVERILTDSEAGKRALAELTALQKSKQEQGQNLQNEINQLKQKAIDGKLALADDKLREIERQVEEKTIALQRFSDDATRELTKRRDEVLGAVEQGIFPIINVVGKEGAFTLIFNKFRSGLLYADDAVDITEEVIKRYNAAAPAAPASPGGK
jgi:outer membrane protein